MHDSEKSDSAIVAVKPPNKSGQPVAHKSLRGFVRLTSVEQKGASGGKGGYAAATASCHWFAASARNIRCVERETK